MVQPMDFSACFCSFEQAWPKNGSAWTGAWPIWDHDFTCWEVSDLQSVISHNWEAQELAGFSKYPQVLVRFRLHLRRGWCHCLFLSRNRPSRCSRSLTFQRIAFRVRKHSPSIHRGWHRVSPFLMVTSFHHTLWRSDHLRTVSVIKAHAISSSIFHSWIINFEQKLDHSWITIFQHLVIIP